MKRQLRLLIGAIVIGVVMPIATGQGGAESPDCIEESPPAPSCGGIGGCSCSSNTCGGQGGNWQYCCTQVTHNVCYHCFGFQECCNLQWVAKCLSFGNQTNRVCEGTGKGCVPDP